jgi:hypothetical protein
MPNFFDQFDAKPAGNFFDQFDDTPHENLHQPTMAEDVLKSGGTGIARGAVNLAGTSGDIREGQADLLSRGAKALGADIAPETISKGLRFLPMMGGPTSKDIEGAAEKVTGPLYQPKTMPGEYAETAGSFLPAALLPAGEMGLGARLLKLVAAPALASETAGQLTKGTAAEPYARAMAAAGAGGLATMRGGRVAAPETAAIKTATSGGYDALVSQNLKPIPQTVLDSLADDLRDTLNKQNIRPANAPDIHAAVDQIRNPATKGAPDVVDLMAARDNIKGLLGAPGKNSAGAAIAGPKINAAIEQYAPGTVDTLGKLDRDWSIIKANEALDKRMARAELQAGGEHSGMNVGNRVRQNVANYLNNNESKYLSPENRAELEKVVKGTWTQNGLRLVSNLLGGGGGLGSTMLGMAGQAAGIYTGHPEMSALPFAGFGARTMANRLTQRQAENAAAAMRNRSNYAKANPPPPPTPPTLTPFQRGVLNAVLSRKDKKDQALLPTQ